MIAAALSFAAIVTLGPQTRTAPPATVRGTVVDGKTATPLADARVVLVERALSVQTDVKGRFEFAGVPPGKYTLAISTIGYIFVRRAILAEADSILDITLPLAEGTGTYQESVTVTAEMTRPQEPGVSSQSELGSAALQELRGVVADDPMRAVQTLPGVATDDDFQALFSVRGSAFRHVGIVIDGVATPLLLHSIRGADDTGSVAMINSDILSRATLLAGPHPQKHGDWLGATLDFDIREGSRDRPQSRMAVSGTSASLVVEGPLGPARSKRGSWLVSVRKSYLDWLIRKIEPDIDSTIGFGDFQTKVAYDLTSRQHLEGSIVGGRATFQQLQTGTSNGLSQALSKGGLVSVAWRYAGNSAFLSQRVSIAYNDFRNRGLLEQELGRGVTRALSWRADATWLASKTWTIEGGSKVEHQYTSETFHQYSIVRLNVPVDRARLSVTGQANVVSGWGLVARKTAASGVSAGARVTVDSLSNRVLTAPWLLGERRIGAFTIRAGAGASHQLGDLELQPDTTGRLPERAISFDGGLEQQLGRGVRWQVTGFRREDTNVLRQLGEARVVGGVFIPEATFRSFANVLDGHTRGVDFLIGRRGAAGPTGWLAYTYAHTRYRDRLTGESFDGDFDQRHTVNLFVQQRLSYRLTASAKLRVGTNFPLAGYFEGSPGFLAISSERNRVRLPFYSRLDIRVTRTFTLTRQRVTLFAEVMNLLNHHNQGQSVGFVRSTREAVNYVTKLIPFVPSVGILIEFQ